MTEKAGRRDVERALVYREVWRGAFNPSKSVPGSGALTRKNTFTTYSDTFPGLTMSCDGPKRRLKYRYRGTLYLIVLLGKKKWGI